jgi:hypothetical protein
MTCRTCNDTCIVLSPDPGGESLYESACPERGCNPEFASFKEEMAEMVMDTCGVPEAEREMWRDLR